MDTVIALKDLAAALRGLHKALVEVTRTKYEAEWGPVDTSQLLQLLTRHPDFQWLHELSAFMAELDALREQDKVSGDDARAAYAQARAMLGTGDAGGSSFNGNYRALLQDAPALVMEHASLKLLLGRH